jgi:hypothetical protein
LYKTINNLISYKGSDWWHVFFFRIQDNGQRPEAQKFLETVNYPEREGLKMGNSLHYQLSILKRIIKKKENYIILKYGL